MNVLERVEKRYTIEKDLAPILSAMVPLPNFRPYKDLREAHNAIVSLGQRMLARWGWANIYGRKEQCWFFLTPPDKGSAASGQLDGRGYVILRREPFAGHFSICVHQSGGNPARCVRCGMRMEASA